MTKLNAFPETFNRVVIAGVDILNDFGPAGALPVAEGDKVVEPFNNASQWGREQGGIVSHIKEAHPAVTNHFIEYGGPWPAHGIEDTWGAQFIDGLIVLDSDIILKKGAAKDEDAYSGYMGIGHDGGRLETYAEPTRQEKVALVIGGLATDYCIKATVLDALNQARRIKTAGGELGVFVLSDAIRAVDVNPGDGERAVQEMLAAGARFVTSDELIEDQVIRVRD